MTREENNPEIRAIGRFVRHRRAAAAAVAVAVFAIGGAAMVMARQDIPRPEKAGSSVGAPQPDGTSAPDPADPAAVGICDSEEALCLLPAEFANIAEGVSLGRLAVLPPGAVPSYDWYNHADKAQGEIELPALRADDPNVVKLDLTLHQVSPPTGFEITGRQVTAVVRADGTARLFAEGVTLTSPDFWPVSIEIYSIKDGRNAETVAPAGGGPSELSVYDAKGTPVLIEHGAPSSRLQPVLRAAFVVGSDYVIVNAGPLPVEILTDLVNRFIAENSP